MVFLFFVIKGLSAYGRVATQEAWKLNTYINSTMHGCQDGLSVVPLIFFPPSKRCETLV